MGFENGEIGRDKMASASKKTETIRTNKRANAGKKRKAQNRNQGTTPTKAVLFGDK